jgi:hypothetical protein
MAEGSKTVIFNNGETTLTGEMLHPQTKACIAFAFCMRSTSLFQDYTEMIIVLLDNNEKFVLIYARASATRFLYLFGTSPSSATPGSE